MLALSAPFYFTWLLIIITSISPVQVDPELSDEPNGSSSLSRYVRDAGNETIIEDNGNLTKRTSSMTTVEVDHKMVKYDYIPYNVSDRDDVCDGCPAEWINTTVTADWYWIWAENERNNYYRRLHGSRDLIINLKLCKCAQLYANKLKTEIKKLVHSQWCLDLPIGFFSPSEEVPWWYREIAWWNFDKGASKSPWGWYISGHFVQVVDPGQKYHCTAYSEGAVPGNGFAVGIHDNPHDEKNDKMWWIYPPKTLKELFAGAGALTGSVQYILVLLIVGAIVREGTLN